jgi:hypothetical protein
MMLSVGSYQLQIPASLRQQSARWLASTEDRWLFVGIGLTCKPFLAGCRPGHLLTLRLGLLADPVEELVAEARAPDGPCRTPLSLLKEVSIAGDRLRAARTGLLPARLVGASH